MMKEKYTLRELSNKEDWKEAVVVFKTEVFKRQYSEESLSYRISRDNKYFNGMMNGNSLFGSCLDGTDQNVRLDIYMGNENGWIVDYCYITEDE